MTEVYQSNQPKVAIRASATMSILIGTLIGMSVMANETNEETIKDQSMERAVATAYQLDSLRIRTHGDYNVPAEKVWNIIAGFDSLPDFHASIVASELKQGGVVRHITMSDDVGGGVVVERLVFFDDENRTFSYRITDLIDCEMAFRNYQAWVHLESTGPKSCRLHWGSNFDVEGATDDETDELAREIYQGCFDGVQKVLEEKP